MVNGYKLGTAEQTGLPSKLTFNDAESTIIDQVIEELQDLIVQVEYKREPGDFL